MFVRPVSSSFSSVYFFFFFNDTATTEIYTLSLHDALSDQRGGVLQQHGLDRGVLALPDERAERGVVLACRSEEHTSELQSHSDLVCRLLLEKKKKLENKQNRPARDCTRHGSY